MHFSIFKSADKSRKFAIDFLLIIKLYTFDRLYQTFIVVEAYCRRQDFFL